MPVYMVFGEDENNPTNANWATIVEQQLEKDQRAGVETSLTERLSSLRSVSLAELAPDGGEGRPTALPEAVPQLEAALRTQVAPWAADF
mmetsp:Transcript_15874/g.45426  ORF Transcript_15874/g.45426 Transcript_15874/m.45426 type:complete len:89 (-) Transcript_15874:57-323(-)